MNELFEPDYIAAHDPGGKVRLKLLPNVRGDAEFSPCGQYRYSLTRRWDDDDCWIKSVLWVGMNPSTAEARVDDPTIRREIGFTKRLGYFGYCKVNVCDYRATNPKDLLAEGVIPCSDRNIATIRRLAEEADIIVAAWGALPKPLRHHAEHIEDQLRADGRTLYCVGRTKEGFPRHTLYVRSDSPLQLYE